MIDWKVRIRNRQFWLGLIPAVLLLIQQICGIFGITVDFANLGEQLTALVFTAFSILAILGVVVDPTTDGIGDGEKHG